MNIGIVIPTYNSKKHLFRCLTPLVNHPVKPRILVIDPESKDGTPEEARRLGAEVLEIPYKSYNHGLTRELGRKKLRTDIVVMMTPDAYLVDDESLKALIAPIENGVAAAYGRQLPRKGAGFFESFLREFNYPNKSHIRSLKKPSGPDQYFFSDSFGAYSNEALDKIGGFQEVLLGEDALACVELLHQGREIAYVAEAKVYHSHCYTLKQEFQRHFDTGLFRSKYREYFSSDKERGYEYVKRMFSTLIKTAPWKIPYGLANVGAKWVGYKVGERSASFPDSLKLKCSSQKFYWKKR